MSKETMEWLNSNVMVGFTAHREKYANSGYTLVDPDTGEVKAWWNLPGYSLGYSGAIPPEEVAKHLFHWNPVRGQVVIRIPTYDIEQMAGFNEDGTMYREIVDLDTVAMVRPDTDAVFEYFGEKSYREHTYYDWLVKGPGRIVDAELGIATAGLLRRGGVAWVSLELPENVATQAGMDIRMALLAATSLDGTRATIYKMVANLPVCDNSLEGELLAKGNQFKVKHSSRSLGKLNNARDALGLVYEHTEAMVAFLDSLATVDVTDAQFRQIVAKIAPIPQPEVKDGKVANQRGMTIAANKQDTMMKLWGSDPRAKQWNGTLLGAFQSFNTWNEHDRPQNSNGVERMMTGTLDGSFSKADAEFFSIVGQLDISLPPALVAVTAGT